ncbi:MAG: hypothetical protein V1708_02750 [Candidatus Micrarchaeota archaeon]
MNKLFPALAVAGMILFSGCITMDYAQEFKADGSSSLTYTMDFTKIIALMQQSASKAAVPTANPAVSGDSFDWRVSIDYADSQSGLNHTDSSGFVRGSLEGSSGAGGFNSGGGFTTFTYADSVAQDPSKGGKLTLNVANALGRRMAVSVVSIRGAGAPTDCAFEPSDLPPNGLLTITCTGITKPGSSKPIRVGVVGVTSHDLKNVLTTSEFQAAGVTYGTGDGLNADNLTESMLANLDVAILSGQQTCDRTSRKIVTDWVKRGGKLIVIGDPCTRITDDPQAIGWDVGIGLLGDIMPAKIGGVTPEREPITTGCSSGRLKFLNPDHPIQSGVTNFQFSGRTINVFPSANSNLVATIDCSDAARASAPASYAILESAGLLTGKVVYFAFDPAVNSRKLFLNTLKYLSGGASSRPAPTPYPTVDPIKQVDDQLNSMCANITAKNPGVGCSRDGSKIVVTKQLANNEGYSFKADSGFPNIKYSVEVESLPSFYSSDAGSSALGGSDPTSGLLSQKELKFGDAAISASAPMLSVYGVKITYAVKMPGKIKKAAGGEIADNVAEFDVLALLGDQAKPSVESEELNTPYVAGAGVAGLAILVAAVYFVFLRRKPPQAPVQAPLPPSAPAGYSMPQQESLSY